MSTSTHETDVADPGGPIPALKKIGVQQIRIASGLILFAYVFTHFGTHAFGLISLDALSYVGYFTKTLWRFTPMSILLYGALAAHLITALWKVFQRRSLKMSFRDWTQLLMGISLPALLITHVVGTGYASLRYGVNDTYPYVLLSIYVVTPIHGIMNSLGLVAAWLHGCIGLNNWVAQKKFYTERVRTGAQLVAGLVPALALTGFLSAAREVAVLQGDGDWLADYFASLNVSDDHVWKWIGEDTFITQVAFGLLLAGLILGRIYRNALARRKGTVKVEYVDGPSVRQPTGMTLLEISHSGGVEHANVCGGRGRCSTCRVRILETTSAVPPPLETELKVLERVNAPEDVRLACQLVPNCDMKIARLLPSDASFAEAAAQEAWSSGQERTVAILFADLRDFTRTSENRLPFDVVYLINQFSSSMGQAVENHEGRIDKFLGDGLMAIFGATTTPENAALQALQTAAMMHVELELLNTRLAGDLDEPLRMGIGIHIGAVVLGNMGYGESRGLTAIGDTVNTASRLESETKAQKCTLCISADIARYAGLQPDVSQKQRISVRGKSQSMDIFALDKTTLDQLLTAEFGIKLID